MSDKLFYGIGENGGKKKLSEKYEMKYNLSDKWLEQDDWKKYVLLIPSYSFFFFWLFTMGTSFLEHYRTIGNFQLGFSLMLFFGQGVLLYILIMLMGRVYWDITGIAYLFISFIPENAERKGWGWSVLGGILAFITGLFGAWLGAYLSGLPHGQEFGQPDNIFMLDEEHVFLIVFFGDLLFLWLSFALADAPAHKKAKILGLTYAGLRALFGFQTGGLMSFIVYFGVSINELVINGNDFPLPLVHFLSIIIAAIVACLLKIFCCYSFYSDKYMERKGRYEVKLVDQ